MSSFPSLPLPRPAFPTLQSTPWRRKVGRLPRKKEPATARFALRCYVAGGADIPQAQSVIRMGSNFKMSVRVSIGSEVLETRTVENEGGVCEVGGRGVQGSLVSYDHETLQK